LNYEGTPTVGFTLPDKIRPGYATVSTRTPLEVVDIKPFFRGDSGATSIEYALIAALVSIAIIASTTFLGGSMSGLFNHVASQITAAAN
jgi:pilus assembly protein Flp/PilA